MTVPVAFALRALPAVLLMLAPLACAPAAAPVPAAAVTVQTPASIQLLDRLVAEAAASTPAVTGLGVGRARAALARRGLRVHVVALQPGARRVSAQWPEAGAPLPEKDAVVVWRGRPPSPPAPSAAEPTAAATTAPATAASPTPIASPTPAAASTPLPSPAGTTAPAPSPPARSPNPPADAEPAPRLADRERQSAAQPAAPSPAPSPQPNDPHGGGSSRSGETLPGRASWYGPGFAGRTTACGGTFDPEQLTLASRELDCGTQVLITGPTGRSVQAVVTDWGPAEWTGRRFDLSRATFEAIADLGAGVVDVKVDVIASR